jgi:hypothetical protein
MHAIADVPLFLIHETSLNATPKGLVHAEWKDHNDGYVELMSGPGLSVEVNEKELGLITLNGVRISMGYVIPTIPDILSTYGIPQIVSRVAAFADTARPTGRNCS